MNLRAILREKLHISCSSTGYKKFMRYKSFMDKILEKSKDRTTIRTYRCLRNMIYTNIPVKDIHIGILGPYKTKELVNKNIVEYTRVVNTKVFNVGEETISLVKEIHPGNIILKVSTIKTDTEDILERCNGYIITDYLDSERIKYYEKLVHDLGSFINLKESLWLPHILAMSNTNKELLDMVD